MVFLAMGPPMQRSRLGGAAGKTRLHGPFSPICWLGAGSMNKVVRNEKRKLSATYLNGIAVAVMGVGGLTQVALMAQTLKVEFNISLFVVLCVLASGALHWLARASLRGMEE